MKNMSIGHHVQWIDGPFTFTELVRQEYANCKFSAGSVSGHHTDVIYIRAEKDGVVTTELLLRPDEVAAIAWVASGALWSLLMQTVAPDGSNAIDWHALIAGKA